MSAISKPIPNPEDYSPGAQCSINNAFLKYLPAVETHANIMFRHLPDTDREEVVAKAAASRGKACAVRPSTLAKYAVLHVRDHRHVGGTRESKSDVMSRLAQQVRNFSVHSLQHDEGRAFDCLKHLISPCGGGPCSRTAGHRCRTRPPSGSTSRPS